MQRAADHLGKLLRSLFLCDYFSNVEFRREMHTLLNRGESVHQLRVQLKPEAALGNTLAAIVTFLLYGELQWFRHFPHI